ncbi:unnamed protein product [Callosobruchus maculatus]|uniref:Uncharacterized protein n=1 Tax=Callosobruchus maculatus TaxID=64391 RepID=A0A653CZV0_CALMS|nr:unnamed protein product [Callosobruchus maculatus]
MELQIFKSSALEKDLNAARNSLGVAKNVGHQTGIAR